MKLEGVDLLNSSDRSAVQIVLLCAFETEEARGIGAEGEVDTDGPDGGSIAQAKARRLDGVIEVFEIVLPEANAESV